MMRSPLFRMVGFALLLLALLMFLFRATVSRPTIHLNDPVPAPAGR